MSRIRIRSTASIFASTVAVVTLLLSACGSGDGDTKASSADADSCGNALPIVGGVLAGASPTLGKLEPIPANDQLVVDQIKDKALKEKTQQFLSIRDEFNVAAKKGDTAAVDPVRKKLKAPASQILDACESSSKDHVESLRTYLPALDKPFPTPVRTEQTTTTPSSTTSAAPVVDPDKVAYTAGDTELRVGQSATVPLATNDSGVIPVKITVTAVDPAGSGDLGKFDEDTRKEVKALYYVRYTVERADGKRGSIGSGTSADFSGASADGTPIGNLITFGSFEPCKDDTASTPQKNCTILGTDNTSTKPAAAVLQINRNMVTRFPRFYEGSNQIIWKV